MKQQTYEYHNLFIVKPRIKYLDSDTIVKLDGVDLKTKYSNGNYFFLVYLEYHHPTRTNFRLTCGLTLKYIHIRKGASKIIPTKLKIRDILVLKEGQNNDYGDELYGMYRSHIEGLQCINDQTIEVDLLMTKRHIFCESSKEERLNEELLPMEEFIQKMNELEDEQDYEQEYLEEEIEEVFYESEIKDVQKEEQNRNPSKVYRERTDKPDVVGRYENFLKAKTIFKSYDVDQKSIWSK